VVFRTFRPMLIILLGGILVVHLDFIMQHVSRSNVATITGLAAACRLVWDLLVWTSHTYVLTNQRVMTIKGVLNVRIFQAPLRKIQRAVVYQPLLQRFLGLGNVGFATASAERFDSYWLMIARPVEVSRQIMDAIHRHQ
jgi:uncharacterized membrane protein YdbT with pleckstrin-like domain